MILDPSGFIRTVASVAPGTFFLSIRFIIAKEIVASFFESLLNFILKSPGKAVVERIARIGKKAHCIYVLGVVVQQLLGFLEVICRNL